MFVSKEEGEIRRRHTSQIRKGFGIMRSSFVLLVLSVLSSLLVAPVSAQSTNVVIDTANLVDPLGYPATIQEYLQVIEFFLKGSKLYGNYTEVGQCLTNLR